MSFTSFRFLLFLPLVFILYYLIPQRFRWTLLLLSSAVFYLAFSWQYLLFFLVVILLNYWLGRNIYSPAGQFRKTLYISGIVFNILVLCLFKYVNYLGVDLTRLASMLHLHYPKEVIGLILPLGMSYLVFTMISYLVDIKRKDIPAEKHAGILAAYFLFFPKVIQGPIERAGRVLPQFHAEHRFDYKGVTGGLKLMTWGFFKKLVIADTLALFVNAVYGDPRGISGPVLVLGIACFAFQLYADFSGYTDIALGAAKILGFDLMQNFERPYLARSIREFWTRWHISLSSWCSDYIFLPIVEYTYDLKRFLKKYRLLRQIRAEKLTYATATFITFLVIGIWHGVGWNFVIVGLLFGLYVNFDMMTKKTFKRFNEWTGITKHPVLFGRLQVFSNFLLLCIVWIFFRAATVPDSFAMAGNLFHGWSVANLHDTWIWLQKQNLNERTIGIMVISTLLLIIADIFSEKKDIFLRLEAKPAYLRWVVYYLVILLIIGFSAPETRQFIYAQF